MRSNSQKLLLNRHYNHILTALKLQVTTTRTAYRAVGATVVSVFFLISDKALFFSFNLFFTNLMNQFSSLDEKTYKIPIFFK